MAAAFLGDEQGRDLSLHPCRDYDRTRLSQRLRPSGDIRHVAENFARRIDHYRPRIQPLPRHRHSLRICASA
jgi:hypothetical protein